MTRKAGRKRALIEGMTVAEKMIKVDPVKEKGKRSATQISTVWEKRDTRKQLVIPASLEERVNRFILAESVRRGEFISFNQFVIELLDEATK